MIVSVLDQQFGSKKALYEHLRAILRGYELGSYVSDEDAAFLTSALRHANKFYDLPDEEPTTWLVQQQSMGFAPEFVFLRADGTRENPSIKRLSLQKKKGPRSPRSAARADIMKQVKRFRARCFGEHMAYRCEECSFESIEGRHFEVDHEPHTFIELWQGFLEVESLEESTLEIVETRDETGIMKKFGFAEPVKTKWREFHKQYAVLRLLCRGCHVHKTFNYNNQGENSADAA